MNGDTLYGVEKVIIGTDVYLLVDQSTGNNGYGSIQEAVTDAQSGQIVLVADGDYAKYSRSPTRRSPSVASTMAQ